MFESAVIFLRVSTLSAFSISTVPFHTTAFYLRGSRRRPFDAAFEQHGKIKPQDLRLRCASHCDRLPSSILAACTISHFNTGLALPFTCSPSSCGAHPLPRLRYHPRRIKMITVYRAHLIFCIFHVFGWNRNSPSLIHKGASS